MESLCFRPPPALLGLSPTPVSVGLDVKTHVNAVGRSVVESPLRSASSWHSYVFKRPPWRLWRNGDDVGGAGESLEGERQVPRGNWVTKILLATSIWGREKESGGGVDIIEKVGGGGRGCGDDDEALKERVEEGDTCLGCCEGDAEKVEFDQRSFSRLLRRVSLAEASLYDRLSYLGLLAYSIPKIKCGNLLRSCGLKFVTSSLERRAMFPDDTSDKQPNIEDVEEEEESADQRKKRRTTTLAAYKIAASAASYLQSQTKNVLSFRSSRSNLQRGSDSIRENIDDILNCEVSSFMATTSSVTAVVAAEEEVKEAVAKDLNSPRSSPCEWFICDDDGSGTRYFVIQGSESLASWKANLLFEPIQFEGLDFVVHRGIYEAAKGIYEQMLPDVRAHLKSHGKSATLQFTGHSLGGSLSLLVNLMLLIRGEVPATSLLPVVTFGSPTILCRGNLLLQELGLPLNHVQAVMMHRDIVPRAFSCNYPDHVAEILKALNKNFRSHPCLDNKKLLYEPMGDLLILQPDAQSSPHHKLLPSGSGLYAIANPNESRSLLEAAQSFFLNSPHPLEILSNRAAFGSNGTISRDHDMITYVRSVRDILRVEAQRVRDIKVEQHRRMWAALLVMGKPEDGQAPSSTRQASFVGGLRIGVEPLKRFGRLVASQHMHMLVVLLLPARVLIMKALAVVSLS